jgi:SHS2 domain-containing protein
MGYRRIAHTGDTGFEIEGQSLPELFREAALGLLDTITDPETVQTSVKREFHIEARDTEQLLVAWLSELLYRFDTEDLLFSEFSIQIRDGTHLKAEAKGEVFDPKRHPIKTEVKGVTYHQLKIEGGPPYRTRVILDL